MREICSNEELAAEIKAGKQELFAQLWAQNKKRIYYLAIKYRSIIAKNAFVDIDDFLQCGYLALVDAVEAFSPEKGYLLAAYIPFKYKKQVYSMFGNVRDGDKRIFPEPYSSLNTTLENDGHETELIDMIADETAEDLETRLEQEEIKRIVHAAVDKLRERERFVIHRIFFDGCAKTDIVDGVEFRDQFQVARTENAAMLQLRRDQDLRALYYAFFPKVPTTPSSRRAEPLERVVAAENWDEWIKNAASEVRRLNGEF